MTTMFRTFDKLIATIPVRRGVACVRAFVAARAGSGAAVIPLR